MRILLIGGTGVISTPLTWRLVEAGHDLTLYNRGATAAELPAGVRRKIRHLRGDRTDRVVFERQMREGGHWDCVIDMVCYQEADAESAIRAFRGRTAQYVFCSTVDVYTKTLQHYPVTEDFERKPPPTFPYAFRKARCEELLFAAHARGELPVTSIRPGATYREGPRGPVHTFRGGTWHLDRLRKGKAFVLHGDGTSIWSACHSEDMARSFMGVVGNASTLGRGYHVTGEEWMTFNRYWQIAAEVLGAPPPRFVHIPVDLLARIAPERSGWAVEHFQYNLVFDNTACRRDLGFRYTIPWREGFARCVQWYEENGGIEDSDVHPWYDRIVEAWERLGERLVGELEGLDAEASRAL